MDLKHRGLMDNTVVVVTTDNGGGPWDSNTPLRGTKVGGNGSHIMGGSFCKTDQGGNPVFEDFPSQGNSQ